MATPSLPDEVKQHLNTKIREHLRERMRRLRSALPPAAVAERSARIVTRLTSHPAVQSARGLALFWPMHKRSEVDLIALDTHARAANKRVYYPFLRGNITGFAEVTDPAELTRQGQAFAEPALSTPAAARGEIDVIIVPALVLAADGNRLGYGRGYYDETLPDHLPPAIAIGVAFDFQLVPEVPTREGDVPLDFIVSDEQGFAAGSRDSGPPRRSLRDRR